MRYHINNIIHRAAALLILLMAGWTAGGTLSAQETAGELLLTPDPETNLTGTSSEDGTVIQPLTAWTDNDTGIYFSFETGTGRTAPAYYANGANVRLYSGNTFQLHVPEGYSVTEVVFDNAYTSSSEKTLSVDTGNLECSEAISDDGSIAGMNYVWTNSDNASVATFTLNDTQIRLTSVRISYTGGSVVDRPKAPVISEKSRTFYVPFEVTIVDPNEPAGKIYYTLDGSEPSAQSTLYTAPVTIPEGADVTLKAVVVTDNGVSNVAIAKYTYEKRYAFSYSVNNKNAINSFSYNTNGAYGNLNPDQKVYIAPGENVTLYWSVYSGYSLNSISNNGVAVEKLSSGYNFTMPEEDAVVAFDASFNPSSPGDPQPPVVKYKLTRVANPSGAYRYGDASEYSAGERVQVYAGNNSGYKFLNWTKDGQTISTESSFYYDMPAADVVLVANYVYAPSDPADPQQPKLTHPLTAVAQPVGSATFSKTADGIVFGEEYYVYAYPQSGYKFVKWILNGVEQEETTTTFRGTMTEAGANLIAVMQFNPSSPDEPNKNYFDPLTGRMVLDHFKPGSLYSAASKVLNGSNWSDVASLTVKGRITEGDLSLLSNLSALQAVDLSRTNEAGRIGSSRFENLPVTSVILPADIIEVNYSAFNGCSNLTSLSVFAQVPPTVNSTGFSGFDVTACELRVPEESIELYKNADTWKDFGAIIPLGDAVHVLEVQLPSAYRDGRLKNNRIDLINAATGRRQRYVITDRPIYTFNGVQKDDEYLILMISESGLEMSRIENVVIPDADFAVAFTKIKEMVPVEAKILSPDNEDVTSSCTIEWFQKAKDNSAVFLNKGALLGKVPEEENLLARITLGRDLALKYTMPVDVEVTASVGMDAVSVQLTPLRATAVSGRVLDEEGEPLSSATVNVSQRIAGKYDRSWSAVIGKDGSWSATVVEAPLTTVTYSQPESLVRTDTVTLDMAQTSNNLGDIRLRSNVGARVHLSLAYTEAVLKGATPIRNDNYDSSDVSFRVLNKTQNQILPVSLRFPTLLVLDQGILPTDTLAITATSASGAFNPVTMNVETGVDFRPAVNFEFKGKGAVNASYISTDSPETMGMLYNASGKLVKKTLFADSRLVMTDLEDGRYTLVAMTKSDILNAASVLSLLDELGLTKGKDYVSQEVVVEDGTISSVEFRSIPSVDESLYSFTGTNTSLTPNKSTVTSGQYLTIRSITDFKTVYRDRISNVKFEFTIPEGCEFVNESVMKGSDKFGYDINGDKVVIDVKKNYSDQIRFCVIPTQSGELGVTGRVIFDLDGQTMSQPLGTATSQVKDFEFVIPNRTGYADITVTGTAPARSKVCIYQDGSLVGEGTSTQNGNWSIDCTLANIYNQKASGMQAKVTTPEGLELQSVVRNLVFDRNTIMVDRVTMLTGAEEVVFDFNHRDNTQTYTWVDDRLFTFIVKLTENAPDKIDDVILWVTTLDGAEHPYYCYYSESRDAWLAVGNFTSSTAPVNVAVSVCSAAGLKYDRVEFDAYNGRVEEALATLDSAEAEAQAAEDTLAANDAKADSLIATIEEAIRGLDDTSVDEESKRALIAAYLTEAGLELPSYEYDESLIGDEEEITRVLEEANRLTMPRPIPDYSEIDRLSAALAALDADETFSEDFEFNRNTASLSCEIDGVTYSYDQIPASEIDLSQYSEDDISELQMDDESVLKVVTDGPTVILIDEKSGIAWRVTDTASSGMFKKTPQGFIESLRSNMEKIQALYSFLKNSFDVIVANVEKFYTDAQQIVNDCRKAAEELNRKYISTAETQRYIERELNKVIEQEQSGNLSPELKRQLSESRNRLEGRRSSIMKELRETSKKMKEADRVLQKSVAKRVLAKVAFDNVMTVVDIIGKVYTTINWGMTGIDDCNRWNRFINSILPCDADSQRAQSIYDMSQKCLESEVAPGYISATAIAAGSAVLSLISTAIGNASMVNPAATIFVKGISIIGGLISDKILDAGRNVYDDTRHTSRSRLNMYIKARNQLKCHKDDPNDEFANPLPDLPGDERGTNKTPAGNDAEKRVIIDPAGYVYEGVHSNRVEGVRATAYYRELVEDIYGDKHLNEVKWNAEEYAQQNPLFTDANGMYAWDVPPGEWRVKFEKDGYNTSFSEWLPVPPPQLEVNVEITQNSQPEVKEVHAYAEGVDIEFDKYMDPSTLTTDNITITAAGDKMTGHIENINLESVSADASDTEARTLVSKVRFVPDESLATTVGKVTLTINRNALSYAGIPMTENYIQELDVEKEVKEVTLGKDLVKVLYGGQKEVTVSVIPAEAGRGRTVTIVNSSPLVTTASVEEVVLDENGQGKFTLTGDLPGSAELQLSVKNTDKTGKAEVKVLTKLVEALSPEASRPNGSVLYKGSKVELTTESENAVIWFTTDGSCPCDENGTRRKYTVPITIDDDMKIIAMTSLGAGDDESEIVEFNYTVKHSDLDFRMEEGWTWISHNLESPVAISTLMADENISRVLGQTKEAIRDPNLGIVGTLNELNAPESYKVQTIGTTGKNRISDYSWNPSGEIELTAGWNWLGYPLDQTMTPDEAFANVEVEEGDVVVGQSGFSEFDGTNWVGTLSTMTPGAGYMYQSKSPKFVVYNSSIVSSAASLNAAGIADRQPLAVDIHKYSDVMPVTAELVNSDGSLLDNEDFRVNAFSGTECRGIGRIINGLFMMNVYGEPGDIITFSITDADGENFYATDTSLKFKADLAGNRRAPYQVKINTGSGVSEIGYEGDVKVYAEGDMLRIKGIEAEDISLVEIYGLDGRKLLRETTVSESGIHISTLTTGIYVVVVNGNGEYTYHRIAIR